MATVPPEPNFASGTPFLSTRIIVSIWPDWYTWKVPPVESANEDFRVWPATDAGAENGVLVTSPEAADTGWTATTIEPTMTANSDAIKRRMSFSLLRRFATVRTTDKPKVHNKNYQTNCLINTDSLDCSTKLECKRGELRKV